MMFIEHTELFQAWLAKTLKPICDADPIALAKYVFALTKKNETEENLRVIMMDQLDVFLQSETKPFVDKLFEAVHSKEYMKDASLHEDIHSGLFKMESVNVSKGSCFQTFSSSSEENLVLLPDFVDSETISETSLATGSASAYQPSDENADDVKTESASKTSSTTLTVISSPLVNSSAKEALTHPAVLFDDCKDEVKVTSTSSRSRDRRDRNDEYDKTRQQRSRIRRNRRGSIDRGLPPSKRSPSPKLDRERDRDRERIDRPLRHKINRKSPQRRYDRDRRRSRSPIGIRNRSCSPKSNTRYRSPPRYRRSYNFATSRSRSPITRGGNHLRSPRSRSPHNKDISKQESSATVTAEEDTNLASNLVDSEKTPVIKSVVVRPSGTGPQTNEEPLQSSCKYNRCRDFDEKGVCMRGELCPFDHGKDPVVLDEILVPAIKSSEGHNGYGDSGRGPDVSGFPQLGCPTTMLEEYYPDCPSFDPPLGWSRATSLFRPRHIPFNGMSARGSRGSFLFRPPTLGAFPVSTGQRQLISVPMVGGNGMTQMPLSPGFRGLGLRHRGCRGGFDRGRLGPRFTLRPHLQNNPRNCSSETRRGPCEQNALMNINHFLHFKKLLNMQLNFNDPNKGQLQNVQTRPEISPFVPFLSSSKEKGSLALTNSPNSKRVPVKERLGPRLQEKMSMDSKEDEKMSENNHHVKTVTNDNHEATKIQKPHGMFQTAESIQRNSQVLTAQISLKNMQDQKKAEALKMSNDLRKRQQTMMEEHIGHQKTLIAKLERGCLNAKEKEETLKILKVLQESVAKFKKDLDDSAVFLSQQVLTDRSKSSVNETTESVREDESQKEIVNTEQDLFSREQQRRPNLQKRVRELRARGKVLGLFQNGGRGRGVYRGIGRQISKGGRTEKGNVRALRSVDHRPTKVRVTGFPVDRLPDILSHFSVFGSIRDYVCDVEVPSMIIDFDSRKIAEIAMAKGQAFENNTLNLEWVSENIQSTSLEKGKCEKLSLSTSSTCNSQLDLGTNSSKVFPDDDESGGKLDPNEILATDEDEDEVLEDSNWTEFLE